VLISPSGLTPAPGTIATSAAGTSATASVASPLAPSRTYEFAAATSSPTEATPATTSFESRGQRRNGYEAPLRTFLSTDTNGKLARLSAMKTIRSAAALFLLALLLALGGCGSGDPGTTSSATQTPPAPATSAADEHRLTEIAIDSRAVGRTLDVSVIEPAGAAAQRPPLLVFLHGAGGSNASFLGNQAVLSTLTQLGDEAPVMAFPDGEESWWHKRSSGDWSRYVVGEVIPAVSRRLGTDPRRVAIGGISMGGFGAYHLGLQNPGRFCAVGGHSSGLWLDRSEEYPGAFDDQSDYERNDVLAAVESDPNAFGPTPVWNDYGDRDWFVPGNAAFVAALERSTTTPLTTHVWPGGHDSAYWDAHWPEYLRFYANALANC
jgi:enterochelin esterase-like enzyme